MVILSACIQRWRVLLILVIISLPEKFSAFGVSNECCRIELYDAVFDFREKCTMTVYWTASQGCRYPVVDLARYVVLISSGCAPKWTSYEVPLGEDGNTTTSYVMEDINIITSCLLGDCYMRIRAELERGNHSERTLSQCVRIGDAFRRSSTMPAHTTNFGQRACVPIVTLCPENHLPLFFINNLSIPYPLDKMETDAYFIQPGTNHFCFNNVESRIILREVCHVMPDCSLCEETMSEHFGEVIMMSRTEIQVIINTSTSESPTELSTANTAKMTVENESYYIPSILMFCNESYTIRGTNGSFLSAEVCVCLPLHEIHSLDPADIMVDLILQENSTFSGTDVTERVLNSNESSQCFVVDINIQNASTVDSLEICLSLLNNTDVSKCVHISDPCAAIILDGGTGITEEEAKGSTTIANTDNATTIHDAYGASSDRERAIEISVPIIVIIGTAIIIIVVAVVIKFYLRNKGNPTTTGPDTITGEKYTPTGPTESEL